MFSRPQHCGYKTTVAALPSGADQVLAERLDAAESAAIRKMLGPRGVDVIAQLARLQEQGVFDAVVLEDGELNFYAAERDFYVAAELPVRPAPGSSAA